MAKSFKRIFQDHAHLHPKKKRACHKSQSMTWSSLKNRKQNHRKLEGRDEARENDGEEDLLKTFVEDFGVFSGNKHEQNT